MFKSQKDWRRWAGWMEQIYAGFGHSNGVLSEASYSKLFASPRIGISTKTGGETQTQSVRLVSFDAVYTAFRSYLCAFVTLGHLQ